VTAARNTDVKGEAELDSLSIIERSFDVAVGGGDGGQKSSDAAVLIRHPNSSCASI
jgi:hypothetical protein